jgi:nucleoside-diphosphate-sugar epimerase
MAKVLVTGGSGFVGRHLVAALAARGDEVTCLVRSSSKADHLQALGVRLVFGDVVTPDGLPAIVAGQDVVYHLAGRTVALKDRQFYEVNRRGAAHMVHACARQETPPVLVHISSLAAAGPAVGERPRVESDPASPVSHYGRSKRSGEHAVESLAHRVPITIVRPPIVFGEADRMSLPMFAGPIRFGIHLAPGLKPRRFSLIHAHDLVQLLILAAERGKRLPPLGGPRDSAGQGYYFAACEQDPSYADLGRLIAESAGRRVLVLPTAIPLVRTVAAVSDVLAHMSRHPLMMNTDKVREIAAGSWLCSAEAARRDLGFQVAAPLFERLRQTTEWYRQEKWI